MRIMNSSRVCFLFSLSYLYFPSACRAYAETGHPVKSVSKTPFIVKLTIFIRSGLSGGGQGQIDVMRDVLLSECDACDLEVVI
uniref:Putative secreted protein n=1 Tax=Anopheles darlingi TaxID=43151 RepID=A0A2M4DJE4_ANODA